MVHFTCGTIHHQFRYVLHPEKGLDYFDVLFYDGGSRGTDNAACYNPDANLNHCLNTALAWMMNSSSVWTGVAHMHFFITYSNDIDRSSQGTRFSGPTGLDAWDALSATWVRAMGHPRYLKIGGRPVFKVLIPEVFLNNQCGGNVTLAEALLQRLRVASRAAGVGEALVGGGWQTPAIPAAGPPPTPRPHPNGYMLYPSTGILCDTPCVLATQNVTDVLACQHLCNATGSCAAATVSKNASTQGLLQCQLLSTAGPGTPDNSVDVYVRVSSYVDTYEWTGTYNAAPPLCRQLFVVYLTPSAETHTHDLHIATGVWCKCRVIVTVST
eukprot:m.571043 g.571043  ORF g.571043 m.571043 type:complete len:326 (-) comp22265_c1_seq27:739-1716(-)